MSQEEVLSILEKMPNKWFTVKELTGKTHTGRSSMSCVLRKLWDNANIYREERESNGCYKYNKFIFKFRKR